MALDRSRFFPPKGAPEAEILAYRDRLINRWSLVRNQNMGRIALSIWYYLSQQWAEFDPEAVFDGVRGSILRQMRDDGSPRPITNICAPPAEEEIIALVKRGWIPKVTPGSNDPRIKAAAQVSHDQLNHRLEQLQWPEKRHQAGLYFVTAGTELIYTGWDKSYEDLKVVASPMAVRCPNCSTKLYSKEVPVETLKLGTIGQGGAYSPTQHLENARSLPMDPEEAAQYEDPAEMEMAEINYCPTCETATPLESYQPTQEEAESSKDVYGRPLSILEPRGGSTLEIDLPSEFYPQDAGVRQSPDTLRRWGRRKIRSMEWWEAHAPHLCHMIEPESANELLYDDPLLGNWGTLGNWSASYDAGILDNHANADEMVDLPSFRYPLGRYVLCSKDVVVIDSDLMQPGEVEDSPDPVYVPCVNMASSRYKIKHTEFWGTTLVEQIISLQNRLNGMDSQIIDERIRVGGLNFLMTESMWVNDAVEVEGGYGAARIFFFKPDLANQIMQPIEFGGKTFNPEVYQERDRVQADAKMIAGSSEAATGNNPTGVGNTSQLQLLIEQDEKSRSIREDSFVRCAQKAWTHLNEMEWILRVDQDEYRTMQADNTYKYEQYTGNALRGQTEVKIDRQPYIEKSVMRREGAREALADGLVNIDSPVAKRKMLEEYGLDVNINEDTNNQVDQAEKQWVDFADKQIVRVLDSIDAPDIRYQVFGTHLLSEQGQELTSAANWDEVQRAIAGWEDELQRINILEAQSIAFYGGRLVGEEANEAYAKAEADYQASEAIFKQQSATFQKQQATPPPVGPDGAPMAITPAVAPLPPTPPPAPVDVPVLLQDRLEVIWLGMMDKRGVMVERNAGDEAAAAGPEADLVATPPPDPRPVYIKFRALVEACRLSIPPVIPGVPAGGGPGSTIPVTKGGPQASAAPAPGPPMPPGTGEPPNPNATGALPEGGAH